MATKCLKPVKGRALRVTRLDGCGRPVYGEDSVATSSSFISVALTANTTDSDEINVTNAAGERCVYEPSETTFTSYSAEITFCEVDPDLFSIVTGNPVVTDSDGNVIGFDVDTTVQGQAFALEVWTGMAAGDACADPNAQGNFGYLLFPFLKGGIVGDFTIENNAVTFTLTGATTRDGNSWGIGPFDVQLTGAGVPGPLSPAIGSTVPLRVITTSVAPPAGYCGARPLLDPSVTALTSVIGTPGVALSVSIDVVPDDLTDNIEIDFGDGTWDYVAGASGPWVHTYPATGAYTVRASSNGTWVTTVVNPVI